MKVKQKDKMKMVVLGAGESGVGAAVLASKKGYDVFVSDKGMIKEQYKEVLSKYHIRWEEGKHTLPEVLSATEVVKSPGITNDDSVIKKIRKKGIPVISEIEFAGRHTKAKMICITGSNGKTTTTLLTYHILKKAGLNVGLAGNVGKSLALQVAEKKFDHYVVELSSFQLDDMYDFRANIAILLNITPDHLDRYDYKLENYAASKFRILQNQNAKDVLIYCQDDEGVSRGLKKRKVKARKFPFSITEQVRKGAFLKKNNMIIRTNTKPFTMSIFNLALQGKHNIYNSMAAGIAGNLLNIRKPVIRESLSDFHNAEHRLEHVSSVHGIEFINDSKATNVNSTWYALESMTKPVVLILGGIDKGNDYSMLKDLIAEKVKAIVCLGVDNKKIHKAFGSVIPVMTDVSTAEEAVRKSYSLAKQGDVVLLSPSCASFDLFQNYEDRGRKFKNAVRSL